MTHPILQPVVALVLWSLVMMLWMVATRLPALRKARIDLATVVGGRGQNLEGVVPDAVQWKSHNYNHLMEQPTLFYAVAIVLALVAPADAWGVGLAWVYVALRIVHSVYQATVNVVLIRSMIFTAYSIVLIGMTLRTAVLLF
jgi:hypothetical protein